MCLISIDESGDRLAVNIQLAGDVPQTEFIYSVEMKDLLFFVHSDHVFELCFHKAKTPISMVPFSMIFLGEFSIAIYSSTLRIMFRGRDPQLPEEWKTVDNKYIIPASYCAIKFGMSLFRDAHHYFSMVSKNVEAYSGVATDIDEDDFLTDGELFSKIITIIKEQYNTGMLRDLSKAQILELARKLHYDFRSSNAQIRRLLKLTQYEVDTLFPLSVKY